MIEVELIVRIYVHELIESEKRRIFGVSFFSLLGERVNSLIVFVLIIFDRNFEF